MQNSNLTIEERINTALNCLELDELVDIWNNYTIAAKYPDEYIYQNGASFFLENYDISNVKGIETMLSDICSGYYNPNDQYVRFSSQTGLPMSFDYLSGVNSPYDQSAVVDWLVKTYDGNLDHIGCVIGFDFGVSEDDSK